MVRWRQLLKKHGPVSMGLQMALAMAVPNKGASAAKQLGIEKEPVGPAKPASHSSPPMPTGKFDFSRLIDAKIHPEIMKVQRSANEIAQLAANALRIAAIATRQETSEIGGKVAACDCINPAPMTQEECRLWLQSYNAGPYALLKYEGNVPYRETQDYAPRVMKYYKMDLSHSPYEPYIVEAARKFGLDPQMIRAIVKTESDFKNEEVSRAGARGLMQVMPVVWNDISSKYHVSWDYSTEVFEPRKNIEVACAYLAWLRYDFLPRHFAAFDPNPVAPVVLVRDRDLGVPPREGPRIVVASADATPASVSSSKEVASLPDATIIKKSTAEHSRHIPMTVGDSANKATGDDNGKQPALAGSDESNAKSKGDGVIKVKAGQGIALKSDHGKIEITMSDHGSKELFQSSHDGKTKVVIRGNGTVASSRKSEVAQTDANRSGRKKAVVADVKVDNRDIKAAQASVKKKDTSLAEDVPRKRDKDRG